VEPAEQPALPARVGVGAFAQRAGGGIEIETGGVGIIEDDA
jgi:hypothetical protein